MKKGKLLTIQETKDLKDGTKVWVDDIRHVYDNEVYIKNHMLLFPTSGTAPWNMEYNCGGEISRIRIYEWINDIKEYFTDEAMKELRINQDLKFQALEYCTNEPIPKFLTSGSNKSVICTSENDNYNNTIFTDTKWILPKQESISFNEAIEKYNKHFTIHCELDEHKYVFDINKSKEMIDSEGCAITSRAITEGKWFVG